MIVPETAAARFVPLKKLKAKLDRLAAEQAGAYARREQLKAEHQQAITADRQRFADALAAGKGEPKREADAVAAELEAQERRAAATDLALSNANDELAKTVEQNRAAWKAEARRQVDADAHAYEQAIAAIEERRAALAVTLTVANWLEDPHALGDGLQDPLAGTHGTPDGTLRLGFSRVLDALRADAEYATHGVNPTDSGEKPKSRHGSAASKVRALAGDLGSAWDG